MYIVFDEMANEEVLKTEDLKEAMDEAYNRQCILIKDGKVIHDYSCDY